MQVRIPDSQAEELRLIAFQKRSSIPKLASEAITEWLERNRAELKRGPKLDNFSTPTKKRTGKR